MVGSRVGLVAHQYEARNLYTCFRESRVPFMTSAEDLPYCPHVCSWSVLKMIDQVLACEKLSYKPTFLRRNRTSCIVANICRYRRCWHRRSDRNRLRMSFKWLSCWRISRVHNYHQVRRILSWSMIWHDILQYNTIIYGKSESSVKWTPRDRSVTTYGFRELHYPDEFNDTYIIHMTSDNDHDPFRQQRSSF